MELNLNYEIGAVIEPFHNFLQHQELERWLLIGAPYYTNQLIEIFQIHPNNGCILAVKDHNLF